MYLYLSMFANEDGQALYKVETPMAREGEADMQDRFAHLAEIEHHVIRSSVMRWGGNEYQTNEYFRKEGWSLFGRNRVFTASNGREYKWLLQSIKCKLVTNDKEEKTIAKSRRRSLGILGPVLPASLEIMPGGEHLIQEILITYIYVEKYRKERERAAKYSYT